MPDIPAPLEAETELHRVSRALADAQADLQRHCAALQKLQGELMISRLEVATARTEIVRHQSLLRTAQADLQAAHASIEELPAIAMEREAEITRLRRELQGAGPVIKLPAVLVLRAARFSRRVLAHNASATQVVARVRGRLPRLGARPERPPAGAPVDPNERYTFKPAEQPGEPPPGAQGHVSLNELYRLSRSL